MLKLGGLWELSLLSPSGVRYGVATGVNAGCVELLRNRQAWQDSAVTLLDRCSPTASALSGVLTPRPVPGTSEKAAVLWDLRLSHGE